MKKQYIYSALVLTALLTAGCAKEIENTFESTDSAAIELSSVSTDPMTKAVITGTEFTTTEAEKGIGLFLLDANGKAYGSNEANVKYTFSSSKWTASQPLRIGNTKGTLVGYYPYSEGATNVKAIPVASSINGTDYLYGSIAEITSAKAKTESLTLSHALTRLRITFKRDNSFVGSGTLSSLSIEGNGIAASGTLDATTGKVSATNSAFTVSDLNATINTDGLTEDCLVVPSASSATPQAVTLKFTVDGKAYKVDLKDELAVKLQSGIQTDITLTMKNTSVSIDGSSIGLWGDGGSQTVTVGGNYTVTIQLDSEEEGLGDDVWLKAKVVGTEVAITAGSISGTKHLKCTMSDGEFCTSQSKTSNLIYTFNISNVTSNTTATIGYAYPVGIALSPTDAGCKVIVKDGELYEGEVVRLVPEAAYSYGISSWKGRKGKLLDDGYDYTVRLSQDVQITACFEENLALGGVFTVANDGKGNVKKVRFTRGNLYYDGSSKVEQHQYEFNSNQWTNPTAHVSHFMWCNNIANATSLLYNSSWDGQAPFFANDNTFTVNGFNEGKCYALSNAEWAYLINKRTASTVNGTTNARYFKGCINKEDGKSINGLFIFPDEFTWPSSVKTLPNEINKSSSGYDNTCTYNDFKRLQDAGMVFLPAAGCRDGYEGSTSVDDAGSVGSYWSTSPNDGTCAYDLYFVDGLVTPGYDTRDLAQSVRLVTECQSEPSAE